MDSHYIKRNQSGYSDAPGCEATGLRLLAELLRESDLHLPEVFHVDEKTLEMTRIETGVWSVRAWRSLGGGLAHLHRVEHEAFGFPEDNYIGLNPQKNVIADNWGEFFVTCRLGYQVSLIENPGVGDDFRSALEAGKNRLVDVLNGDGCFPSLVHGDLWRGNVLCDPNQRAWLIDPAVYYGDREVDIAMTEMFGGFGDDFYRAYNEVFPLSPNYGVRKPLYNLYHYLNHYNLFGEGYLSACRQGFELIRGL